MSRRSTYFPVSLTLLVMVTFILDTVGWELLLEAFRFYQDRRILFVVFGAWFGCLAGQTLLAAFWLALAKGPLAIRLPASLAVFTLVLFSFFLGASLAGELQNDVNMLILAALSLGLFLAVTIPLWIMRLVARWQIVGDDSARSTGTREQFSLRQVLAVTAGVAILLAVAKAFFGESPWRGGEIRLSVILQLAVFVFSIGAYISLVTWPLLWTILAESPRNVRWLLLAAGAMVTFPFVVSEAFFAISGIGRPPYHFYPALLGTVFVFGWVVALVSAGGFFAARCVGLRLVRLEFRE